MYRSMYEHLQHHGIKGQHWGIRRFQEEDGTLTSAGKRRYDVDIDTAKQKLDIVKQKSKNAMVEYYNRSSKDATANYNKSIKDVKYAKKKLKEEIIKEKLNNENKISKRREKLKNEYLSKGMTEQNAAIAAYKRERTEKAIKAVAAVAITAAVAYAGYKYYDKNVDKIIRSDKILHRVASDSTMAVRDAFYFSMNNNDNATYRGMYGAALKMRTGNAFAKTYKVDNAIKVASENSAVKALKELTSDDNQYANNLKSHLERIHSSMGIADYNEKQIKTVQKGIESLTKGKINSDVYKALNFALPFHHNEEINKAFYDKLTSKGYNAIVDINDKYLSGYNTTSPMIGFNLGSSIKSHGLSALTVEGMKSDYKKYESINAARQMTNSIIKTAVVTAAVATVGKLAANKIMSYKDSKEQTSVVEQYKREHPETKLSDSEILNAYYNY